MSLKGVQSELRAALGKSKTEKLMSQGGKLSSSINRDGFDSENVLGLLTLYSEISAAIELDLGNWEAALNSALAEADGIFADEHSAAKARRDADTAKARDDETSKAREIARNRETLEGAVEAAQRAISDATKKYESLNWLDRKLVEKSYHAECIHQEAIVQDCQEQIEEADRALAAAHGYCERQVEDINRACSRRLGEIKSECESAKAECVRMKRDRATSLTQAAQKYLEGLVSKEALQLYRDRVESVRPDYEHYHPIDSDSFEEPGDFYLGSLRWKSDSGKLLSAIDCQYVERAASSGYLVSLPYVVDLSKGLQVLIRPTGSDDAFWDNDCVRALTLRLLMAYPPGKLQMTLIDPFKNGISFSGIPDIVDKHHESIISGGVLTEAEYIAQALRSLRTKMANYSGNQGYGRDRASYFHREPVQAVIINDFPNGFTSDSLADLARLMENSSSFGMLFIIGMNPTYESDYLNSPDYKAVLSRTESVHLKGDNPSCLAYNDTRFELTFGDEEDVISNSDRIVKAMRAGVITAHARKEHFAQLFPNATDWQDENAWRRAESSAGVMIPLGISGASKITQVIVGLPGASTMHHGLIAGPTGAGKSTALHTMIMSTLLSYSPDEVQLVLIDFKEGTEFRSYAPYRIPNFRSITTTTEPEFALAALEDVLDEYNQRASVMTGLLEYRMDNDIAIPQILLFFDEVQALFADGVREDIRSRCLEILTILVTKGRAMGIHVFLASQNFERVSCIQPLMSDMKIRLCLKDSDTGGILQDATALRDAPAGSAILNNHGGAADKNDLFQVCMLEDDERDELLRRLSNVYSAPGMTERYESFDPRLLFTNIEDDFHHPMNAFIERGEVPPAHETDPVLRIGSLLKVEGNSTPYKGTGRPFNLPLERENLLLIGDNSDVSKSIFIFAMLSIGLDSLSRSSLYKDEVLLFDFTEGGLCSEGEGEDLSGNAALVTVYNAFPSLIKHVPTSGKTRRSRRERTDEGTMTKLPAEQEVDRVYQELQMRKRKCDEASNPDDLSFPRTALMLYGINNALRLSNVDSQEGGVYGELSTLAKLQAIFEEGSLYDIYSIVWGQTLSATDRIVNFNSVKPVEGYFQNRVVFSASDTEFQSLTACVKRPATNEGAAFCNINSNLRAYFRPFDVPKVGWVEAFRSRFEEVLEF